MARRRHLLNAGIGVGLAVLIITHTSVFTSHKDSPLPHGVLNCSQVEQLWKKEGGSPSAAFMAAEIVMAESTGHEDATDRDSDGSVDRGLFQINSVHGSLSTYNVDGNVKAAIYLSDDGTDWNDWVTYHRETYLGKC
jgi:hypothetical protein